jgi:hypothetical protein
MEHRRFESLILRMNNPEDAWLQGQTNEAAIL